MADPKVASAKEGLCSERTWSQLRGGTKGGVVMLPGRTRLHFPLQQGTILLGDRTPEEFVRLSMKRQEKVYRRELLKAALSWQDR